METDLTRPLRDDEQPSLTRTRFDTIFGVFKSFEARIGPVNGDDAAASRRSTAATLTLAYFITAAGEDTEGALHSLATSVESIS